MKTLQWNEVGVKPFIYFTNNSNERHSQDKIAERIHYNSNLLTFAFISYYVYCEK